MTPTLRVRLRNASRVLRGIVDVDEIRRLYNEADRRADAEMQSHRATIDRCNVEAAKRGNELSALRANLRDELESKRAVLESADRHAREHMARAEALKTRCEQMEADAKRELLYWYNPKAEIGCRWVRDTQYPPGTVLEKRNAANQAIARSIDGGQTWHEVRETVVVPQEKPA